MKRSGISRDSPDGKHDTGHEAVAVDRVVADRERLALAAEDDLLVGDQPGEPNRVDRLVDVASPLRDQLGGPLRGSRWGVELAVVMELDDLALGHVLRCLPRELHHQDGADREVRGDEALGVPTGPIHRVLQLVQVEARRSHHRVNAGLDRLDGVRQHGLGGRELDHHVGTLERLVERNPELGVGLGGDLHALGGLYGLNDRRAHAPRGAGDGYTDHVKLARASLTGRQRLAEAVLVLRDGDR